MPSKKNVIIRKKQSPEIFAPKLPSSKSISNRLLILKQFYPEIQIENLGKSNDVKILQKALELLNEEDDIVELDLKDAGTAMRFITALSTCSGKRVLLNGSPRMQQRPIMDLADGLRQLGANVIFLANEGFPPILIKPSDLLLPEAGIRMKASVSSQYISAIMLIAPFFDEPMRIHIKDRLVSRPYIEMTAALLKKIGAAVTFKDSIISVDASHVRSPSIKCEVESDWSALAPWLSILASNPDMALRVNGLNPESIQGDKESLKLARQLGIESEFNTDLVLACVNGDSPSSALLSLDMTQQPDLVQSFVILCLLKRRSFQFTGLETLRIKESDRLADLAFELKKVGIELDFDASSIGWNATSSGISINERVVFDAHNDHRLAMALAALAHEDESIEIRGADCVKKSYPGFFKELAKAGYDVSWQ